METMMTEPHSERRDPCRAIQEATRVHRREHGCSAYTFEDGPGLRALSANFKPKRILELGTALGYTACCLASGSPFGHVDTIEGDQAHVELARHHIAGYNLFDRISVLAGDFSERLESLSPFYDFIFFDGFAPDVLILKRLQTLLARDGVLVCANLQLAAPSETQRMLSTFSDVSIWRSLPNLERGATAVWLKI